MKEKNSQLKATFEYEMNRKKNDGEEHKKLVSRLSFFKTQLVYDANEAIMLW